MFKNAKLAEGWLIELNSECDKRTDNSCGVNCKWIFDKLTKTLFINGTDETNNYRWRNKAISIPWSSKRKQIESIVINEGITTIGDYGFHSCSFLTSITIPNSVTTIGVFAFYNCSSLKSITIPKSVTTIGEQAFLECTSLTSVTIPDSITRIGDGVFAGTSSLTSIDVSESNQYFASVDDILFTKDMKTLICYPAGKKDDSFSIPNSVTIIYGGAFCGCSFISSVIIPNSVTKIGDATFSSCPSLLSITIPSNVTEIGERVFFNCSSLRSIDVSESNQHFASVNGVLFTKDMKAHICYPAGKKEGSFSITNSVTTIEKFAFAKCSLTSIIIPNNVITIEDGAFSSCSSLSSIKITNSATTIGKYAFEKCSSLTSIIIPDNITTIGRWCFYNCSSLTTATLPKRFESQKSIFYGCCKLKTINWTE